jgi:hypothetical protein
MRIMHLIKPKKLVKYTAIGLLVLLIAGLLWPENLIIPVKGATKNDWNHQTFWYEPWGSPGVHKGIDIFGKTGAEVVASTAGIVVFSGQLPKGGNAIAVLGPKWRIHYFAHLNTRLGLAQKLIDIMDFQSPLGQGVRRANSKLFNRRTTQS